MVIVLRDCDSVFCCFVIWFILDLMFVYLFMVKCLLYCCFAWFVLGGLAVRFVLLVWLRLILCVWFIDLLCLLVCLFSLTVVCLGLVVYFLVWVFRLGDGLGLAKVGLFRWCVLVYILIWCLDTCWDFVI